jgi:hypothetical protein
VFAYKAAGRNIITTGLLDFLKGSKVSKMFEISIKGRKKSIPAFQVNETTVVVQGHFIKTAEIFDEYWLEADKLPNPDEVIREIQDKVDKPDLFTFEQRVPDVEPRFNFHTEWDNIAVLPISTYEHWFQKQISSATRRNVRASEKRGVLTRVAEYNEDYIRGIMSIYNESAIRQGRKFWHYGKDFESVKKENGTYAERSTFLGAYHQNEMIGYLKIVWDKRTAAIMQILSKISFLENRPNNALLAEAVRRCCNRGVKYLLYNNLIYLNKTEDSLTKFKQNNGFVRMDIPRYYIPLTRKGSMALRLGFHKSIKERLPEWIMSPARDLRAKWYGRKMSD